MSYQSHTWYDRLEKPSTYAPCYCVEFGQTLWPLLRNLSCSQDQDHVNSTHISAAPTLEVRNNMLSIHLKMFYSYTRNRHKNMLDRINAPSYCKCLSGKVSIAAKRGMGYAKVIQKKYWKKMDKCLRYWKQWVLRCLPEKRKRDE